LHDERQLFLPPTRIIDERSYRKKLINVNRDRERLHVDYRYRFYRDRIDLLIIDSTGKNSCRSTMHKRSLVGLLSLLWVAVLLNIRGKMRIQLESGRLTNMSVAAITRSGQLALQATLSGLTHAKCSQDG